MQPSVRAVVADDNEVFLRALVSILEEDRIEVVETAIDGLAAVRAVRGTAPDVLIADIKMPGLDGVALTSAVRSQWPLTAVVCLTAYDDEAVVQAAAEAGAYACLIKGSRAAEIIQAVRCAALTVCGLAVSATGGAQPPRAAHAAR